MHYVHLHYILHHFDHIIWITVFAFSLNIKCIMCIYIIYCMLRLYIDSLCAFILYVLKFVHLHYPLYAFIYYIACAL